MNIKKWLKSQAAAIIMASSNVEKNSFTQEKKTIDDDVKHEKKQQSLDLLSSLQNNVVTQEVKDLRWRMYKVLKASEKISVSNITYDKDDNLTGYSTSKIKSGLDKIKLDSFDRYPLEMVYMNDEQTINSVDVLDNKHIGLLDDKIFNEKEESFTIGEIHGENLAHTRPERQLTIERKYYPKFFIENYTKKLNVRFIDNQTRLLEFYISKYPDEMNPATGMLVKQLVKIINGTLPIDKSDFIQIDNVEFVSNKTIGTSDYLQYRYNDITFDKLIEFDGNYIIKYIANVEINGADILAEYIQEELDMKYENKEIKKRNIAL